MEVSRRNKKTLKNYKNRGYLIKMVNIWPEVIKVTIIITWGWAMRKIGNHKLTNAKHKLRITYFPAVEWPPKLPKKGLKLRPILKNIIFIWIWKIYLKRKTIDLDMSEIFSERKGFTKKKRSRTKFKTNSTSILDSWTN